MLNDPSFKSTMKTELDTYSIYRLILVYHGTQPKLFSGEDYSLNVRAEKDKSSKFVKTAGKLRDLEQVHIDNKEPSIIHQMRNVKQEMDKILSEEVEKNIRFMKQRYYEAGPKAWRLRKQQAENTIDKITDPVTHQIIAIWMIYKMHLKHITNLYILNQLRLIDTLLLNF